MAEISKALTRIRRLGLSLVAFVIITRAEESSQLPGEQKVSQLCEATAIVVKAVYLTCNSPVTNNDGSASYTQSTMCKYGDTVNLTIFYTINSHEISTDAEISVDMGVYNVLVRVQAKTKLCDFGITQSLSSGDLYCPSIGEYRVDASLWLQDVVGDEDLLYTPDVRLRFYAGDETGSIIGCASTGTIADYLRTKAHSRDGQIALGIVITVFCGCFACLLIVTYRRKKRLQLERAAQDIDEASHYGYVRSSKSGHVMRLDANGQLH